MRYESRPESVAVRAEPEVRHKFVVAVIDRLRAAGVESITVR